MIQISQISELSKISNYKENLSNIDIPEYIIKYISVIFDLFDYAKREKYKYKREYLNYIIKQGFNTMMHIFTYMLMYTKNIDLTFFHLQKGLYYYLEFIQQIKRDEHQFLQFNIKDAIIFVYKKTIYDIDQDYIRHTTINNKNREIIEKVRLYIEGWNQFTYDILQKFLYVEKFENVVYKDMIKSLILVCKTQFDKNIQLNFESILEVIDNTDSNSIIEELNSIIKNINQYKKNV